MNYPDNPSVRCRLRQMKLGISRDTVRRYQRMNEKEFEGLISSEILRRKRKLEAFEGFIKQLLQDCPFLSTAQIHDRLKENFPDLPEVSEHTVYNTVRLVREREELPKVQECGRQMSKVPDCEYGEKAQVDFGEKVLRTSKGSQVKVYFMVMVLQRKHQHRKGSLQGIGNALLNIILQVDYP